MLIVDFLLYFKDHPLEHPDYAYIIYNTRLSIIDSNESRFVGVFVLIATSQISTIKQPNMLSILQSNFQVEFY